MKRSEDLEKSTLICYRGAKLYHMNVDIAIDGEVFLASVPASVLAPVSNGFNDARAGPPISPSEPGGSERLSKSDPRPPRPASQHKPLGLSIQGGNPAPGLSQPRIPGGDG